MNDYYASSVKIDFKRSFLFVVAEISATTPSQELTNKSRTPPPQTTMSLSGMHKTPLVLAMQALDNSAVL